MMKKRKRRIKGFERAAGLSRMALNPVFARL